MSASTAAMPARRGAEHGGPLHQRATADALRAPVGERAGDLLLERLEQARCHHEHDGPEAVQRGVRAGVELVVGQDLEAVRRDAGDEEPGADRVGALGDVGLGGVDETLGARGHACAPCWVCGRQKRALNLIDGIGPGLMVPTRSTPWPGAHGMRATTNV